MKNTNHIIITQNYPIQYRFSVERTKPVFTCLEEMAWQYHWISTDDLKKQIGGQKSSYYTYIQNLIG